jgi:superfamily II DNA or RNA helicase
MSDLVKLEHYSETFLRVRCEPSIMYEMCDAFTFMVPGAKFSPKYKNKIWDGKIRLLNTTTGLIYRGLVDSIVRFCDDKEYPVIVDPMFAADEFSLHELEQLVESLKLPFKPHDYQLDGVVHAIRNKRSLLISPTASGKSLMIYLITRHYRKKTLIVVPSISLVHQLYSDFAEYGFDSEKYVHKVYQGQDKVTDKPVVITTWQSIVDMPKKWFESYDVVIGDEAHNFKAKSLVSIMSKMENIGYRFGFTGTLDGTQTNKLVLEGLFGKMNQVITTAEMIDQKHASDFIIKAIVLLYKEEERKVVAKMTYPQEMDFLIANAARNKFIKNLTLSLKGNTLLLFQFVDKHGKILYNMIKEEAEAQGRKVFFIHGGVAGDEREAIRHIVMKEKNAIIIASFGTMSTGTNIPNLDDVIFASPSKGKIRNLQSIGRVLRKADGKTIATLYDIADDLAWNDKKNYTLLHFVERMNIYAQEQFEYKTYTVKIT